MNKVHSKVWSCALNQLVVASELVAGRHGGVESGRHAGDRLPRRRLGLCIGAAIAPLGRRSIVTVLSLLAGVMAPGMAVAQYSAGGGTTSGAGQVAISGNCSGSNAQTLGGSADYNAIAIGCYATTQGINATAIGPNARALASGTVALGVNAIANAANATAIGVNSSATAAGASVLGLQSVASGVSSTAVGTTSTATADYAFAGGYGAQANALRSIALGNQASATVLDAIAQGTSASAGGQNAIAIGFQSIASEINSINLGARTVAGTGATAAGAIAIGTDVTASMDRAVAMGISSKATDTDALAIGTRAAATASYATALGGGPAAATAVMAAGVGSVAIGGNATSGASASGADAIAVGGQAVADANDAVAIGHGSTATGGKAVAVGSGNVANGNGAVAIGDPNTATGNGAIASGMDNTATGDGSVAMGNTNMVGGGGQAVSTPGTAAQGAVGIGYRNTVVGQGSVAIGNTSSALAAGAVAFGDTAVANHAGDVALGSGSSTDTAVGTPSYVIDGTTYNFAGTTPNSTVSVGASGAERTITNVAAGRISGGSTDAINGSQLFATNQAVDTVGTTVTNLGNTIATSIGGSTTYDPATGNLTTSITYGGNTYNSLQNVFTQIDGSLGGGGIKYFHANSTLADSQATGTDSVAIGPVSTASTTDAVSIGNGATAGTNVGDVALGAGSVTGAVVQTGGDTIDGVAYTYAGATPTSTVSVGDTGAERTITHVAAGQVNGGSTDAVNGSQLFATNQAVENLSSTVTANAIHYYSVNDGGTTGGNYVNDGATGLNALAAGVGASATADSGTALGQNTQSTVLGGVALGSGAISDRAIAPTSGSILVGTNVIPYNTTDRTLLGAVSVGNATDFRQITNVADGTLDQDAVTLRQLKGAMSSFSVTPIMYFHANSTASDSAAIGAESVAIGPQTTVNGDNGIGMGNGAIVQQTAPGGTAIGQNATVNLADGVALGTNATSSGIQALALGAGTEADYAGSVALGAGSVTDAAVGTASTTLNGTVYNFAGATPGSTVSVGSAGAERTITNLAAGRIDATSTDAINGSQLFATNQTLEQLYTSLNSLSNIINNLPPSNPGPGDTYQTSTDDTSTASASGDHSTAAGAGATASGDSSTAIGAGATASGDNSVAIGAGSVATEANSVSVGSVGNERTVTNVAPGVNGTDAVNVDQLDEALESAKNWSKNYVDQRFESVNRDLNRIGNRANAGVASAIAMASLPQAYQPNQNAAAVALGSFHGETGIAVGVSAISESGRYVLKLNATTNSRGDAGAGVGAALVW